MDAMRRRSADGARESAQRAAHCLAGDPRVRLIYGFGSTFQPDRATVRDIDLAILTDPPLTLEELTKRQADVMSVTGAPIDLVSLNDASIVLAHEIVESGVCLYARTPDVETELVTRVRTRYWDFRPYRDEQWRLAGERLAGADLVLRPDAIRERLLRLEEVISRLEELRRLDARALREGFRDAWAVERGLQLGAEIVFDIGNHILSAHFGVSAQDYEDIIAQLGAHNVIGAPLLEELKGLGGFRNILVHGYLRVDPDRVARSLQVSPTRFSEFARAVRAWLEKTAG
jgi:uncharacterized protein YutE (UPF0331/DUF86 family)/predicted nucleotidyltransferase